jgi:hypothetical protein
VPCKKGPTPPHTVPCKKGPKRPSQKFVHGYNGEPPTRSRSAAETARKCVPISPTCHSEPDEFGYAIVGRKVAGSSPETVPEAKRPSIEFTRREILARPLPTFLTVPIPHQIPSPHQGMYWAPRNTPLDGDARVPHIPDGARVLLEYDGCGRMIPWGPIHSLMGEWDLMRDRNGKECRQGAGQNFTSREFNRGPFCFGHRFGRAAGDFPPNYCISEFIWFRVTGR